MLKLPPDEIEALLRDNDVIIIPQPISHWMENTWIYKGKKTIPAIKRYITLQRKNRTTPYCLPVIPISGNKYVNLLVQEYYWP